MATPTIIINNVTGSDIAASGAGPSTALTGTSASTSGTGLVITLDGSPDLTNVVTDGSHVLWLNTVTGRQFAAITAKDNTAKTVTTATAYSTSLTGRTWAIGGKRATLDDVNTRKLLTTDIISTTGWAIDIQEAGSNYILTSSIALGSALLFTIYSSTTNPATITSSVSGVNLFTTGNSVGLSFRNLKFTHTGTTRGRAIYPLGAVGVGHSVLGCVFDGMLTAIDGSNSAGWNYTAILVEGCEFKNGTSTQFINSSVNPIVTEVRNCFFHDNAGPAIGTAQWLTAEENVFSRNTYAINSSLNGMVLRRNVFHGGTTGGLLLSAVGSGYYLDIEGNVFYGNAGIALAGPANTIFAGRDRSNAFGANGSVRSNFVMAVPSTTDITLSADPFTLASSNDFTLNATVGGGALLRAAFNNVRAPGLVGSAYGDVGPFQSQATGSSNNIILHRRRKVM